MQTLTLRDGTPVPALGLGTWKSDAGAVGRAVRTALELGYRHIDCAPIYGNEPEVGDAITDALDRGTVSRGDLWVTSKLWNDCHAADAVVPARAIEAAEIVPLAEAEKRYLQHALAVHEGDRKSLATALGISERALYRKLAAAREPRSPRDRPPVRDR